MVYTCKEQHSFIIKFKAWLEEILPILISYVLILISKPYSDVLCLEHSISLKNAQLELDSEASPSCFDDYHTVNCYIPEQYCVNENAEIRRVGFVFYLVWW